MEVKLILTSLRPVIGSKLSSVVRSQLKHEVGPSRVKINQYCLEICSKVSYEGIDFERYDVGPIIAYFLHLNVGCSGCKIGVAIRGFVTVDKGRAWDRKLPKQ